MAIFRYSFHFGLVRRRTLSPVAARRIKDVSNVRYQNLANSRPDRSSPTARPDQELKAALNLDRSLPFGEFMFGTCLMIMSKNLSRRVYYRVFLSEHNYPNNTISRLISLIRISLDNSIFNFNQAYFKQTKGTPMGSPLSFPLSEIVMRHIDKHIHRYIDDIFAIVKTSSLDNIFSTLNNLYQDICFTVEIETNNTLAFLDILITKIDNRYTTSVYYKPSFFPSYIHFSSYCPLSHKINTVKTLTKHIFTHCTTEISKQQETNTILSHLLSLDYPKNFILRHFHNPLQTASLNISNYLKNFGIRTFYSNTPNSGTLLRNSITKNSFPLKPIHFNNAVYSLKCNNCSSLYIGETGRHIKDRIDEHIRNIRNNDPRSLIAQHISNTGHTFNTIEPRSHFSNIQHKYKRLVVEALLSLKYNSINRHIDISELYNEIFT
ncbi:hypothetical protein LAZ67_16000957 [Cordylochernes scorpioides]|uniref:Helix-turn-helix domain-containing protein n=1 Tax=Cordylochernes scorpioides TaxID=51811 RepID=A0ABY6LC62_9ARAC|nr:hypothetical protein LAZ67_16000957 [Cordylochernes scorpioides]